MIVWIMSCMFFHPTFLSDRLLRQSVESGVYESLSQWVLKWTPPDEMVKAICMVSALEFSRKARYVPLYLHPYPNISTPTMAAIPMNPVSRRWPTVGLPLSKRCFQLLKTRILQASQALSIIFIKVSKLLMRCQRERSPLPSEMRSLN